MAGRTQDAQSVHHEHPSIRLRSAVADPLGPPPLPGPGKQQESPRLPGVLTPPPPPHRTQGGVAHLSPKRPTWVKLEEGLKGGRKGRGVEGGRRESPGRNRGERLRPPNNRRI